MTTTNDDKPFEPGEIIVFCDEEFEVVENHGDRGTVRDPGDTTIYPFYWTFEDIRCRRKQ